MSPEFVSPEFTLGAALAFAVSFVAPLLAQFMLVTIPLWIMVAVNRARAVVVAS